MRAGLPAAASVPGSARIPRTCALPADRGHRADLLALLRGHARPGEELFYLERPAEGFGLAAVGAVAEVRVAGPGRFERAARRMQELLRRVGSGVADETARAVLARAAAVATFSFDPQGPGRLVVPREIWVLDATGVRGVRIPAGTVVRPGPMDCGAGGAAGGRAAASAGDRPPSEGGGYAIESELAPAHYLDLVTRGLAAICAGELEKVVVARSVSVRALGGRRFEPLALAGALRERHPSCTVFCQRLPDGSGFVGATPELLLRRRGGWIESEALAGTAAAGADAVAAERFLLGSEKERAEHRSVVEAISGALRPHCETLDLPAAPRPRRHEGVVHLHTPIRGRLHRDATPFLELLGSLHPSPAVAGAPAAAALGFLRRYEGLDRGLYGGAIGFLGTGGEGEFFVALRCAHLEGARARLYAGAGVVAGSSPDGELAETRIKLGTVLPALLEL